MRIEILDDKLIKRRQEREKDTMASDRKFSYESSLGVDIRRMEGKRVLDIGSGSGNSFATEAAKYNVDVVSISPDFRDGTQSPMISADLVNKENTVAARAQELPFADNSFDFELALYSVP